MYTEEEVKQLATEYCKQQHEAPNPPCESCLKKAQEELRQIQEEQLTP